MDDYEDFFDDEPMPRWAIIATWVGALIANFGGWVILAVAVMFVCGLSGCATGALDEVLIERPDQCASDGSGPRGSRCDIIKGGQYG